MQESRLKIAKPDIIKALVESGQSVFKRSDIDKILQEGRSFWRLAKTTNIHDFVDFLLEETDLKKVELKFPSRKEIRYTLREESIYTILMTLKPDCYFSHYTAVHLHELTEQIPMVIYVNAEQPTKAPNEGHLEQGNIDRAFKNSPRTTNNVTIFGKFRICYLNGKNTGRLGVIDSHGPNAEAIRVTDVERTLIDITVRPVYSGGVHEVAKAFRLAREKDKVSVNRMIALLKKLDYTYPYHQALGFYLEKAGVYDGKAIDLVQKIGMDFDFYLTNKMDEMDYSKKWRLYFPKGF